MHIKPLCPFLKLLLKSHAYLVSFSVDFSEEIVRFIWKGAHIYTKRHFFQYRRKVFYLRTLLGIVALGFFNVYSTSVA